MAFGSYLVLAATILVALGTLVSCAMRRTIVNRKSRKKRIAENAEMSGENFYNRQAKEVVASPIVQPTMPVVSGANGQGNDKLPAFASFEKNIETGSEERIPLTARSPSERSPRNPAMDMNNSETAYDGPVGPMGPGPRRAPSRDQFGNPINSPPDAYGMRRPSIDSQRSRGRGGMPPSRGRGGYGPPRGGYGAYGPGPGRGGYPPPGGRGGYGPPPGRGGYGLPPRGYGGPMMRGGRPPPPPSYTAGPYDQRGSPANDYDPYGARRPSPGPPSAPGYAMNNMSPPIPTASPVNNYEAYNPNKEEDLPRAESPPPLPGFEDDIAAPLADTKHPRTGTPQQSQQGQFRDSDADIMGMVGLQQGRATPSQRHDTYMSGSHYSQPDE